MIAQDSPVPPSNFVCPLTQEIMNDPVMTKYGHSFEKRALIQWMNRGKGCPLTRQALGPSDVISNRNLQQQITGWKKRNNYVEPVQTEEEVVAQEEPVLVSFASSGGKLEKKLQKKLVRRATMDKQEGGKKKINIANLFRRSGTV